MLVLLPLTAFVLCWILLYQTANNCSLRASFLGASLLWGTLVTVNTEILSLFSLLHQPALTAAWLFEIVVLCILSYPRKRVSKWIPTFPGPSFRRSRTGVGMTTAEIALIACTTGIIIVVGITAFIAPPNNWDSMPYHMARVAHWIQNKTVQFFPTSIPRQLWASPWAEYAIAQFQILSQSDRFANMIQWWSMAGSVVGVSLIAKLLGATRRGQILSAVVCASLPVGILEGSSTQNDYVAAFWMVCCVYHGLKLLTETRYSTALWCGLSLGLAVLTKATAMTFVAPFIIWTIGTSLRKHGKAFLPIVAILVVIPLALNLPQFTRNHQLSGNIFSLHSETKGVKNETYTIQGAVSTAIRYAGLNLAINNDPFNKTIETAVVWVHRQLNWNILDPRYTAADEYRVVYSRHEDSSGNTAATLTFFITTILFLLYYRRTCSADVLPYLLSWTGAFFLFCLMLKWQPWGNRLLLPLAVLSAPFIGTVLNKTNPRINTAIAIALIIFCLPWVLNNKSRPIISKDNSIFIKDRNEQYFTNVPGMYFSYQRAAEEVQKSGCKDIGLMIGINSWEYPLWALWDAPRNKNMRIEHINVHNPSKKFDYPLGAFDPCAVINDGAKETAKLTVNDQTYVKTNQWAFLNIFLKDPNGTIEKMVRNSYFSQMIQSSMQSDQILMHAQTSSSLNQETMMQAYQLRRMAIEEAKLLDIQGLNGLYQGLGSAVKNLFIKGNELFLEGLTGQDSAKINQGQSLLDQWNVWLQGNMKNLQKILQ